MKRTHKILYTISAAYLLWLLLVLALFGYTPTNDGDGYIEFAQVCIRHGQSYPCLPLIQGQPFVWNIGSVNLTALSLLWFRSLYPLLVLLCFMKAITALLVGKIALKLFTGRVAVIACVLYVLYPNNWGQSTTILSEIPMVSLALAAFYMAVSREKPAWLFASGMVFGLANWFRPVAMVYMGTLLLYYLFFIRKDWMRKSLSLCCGYAAFIIIVGLQSYLRTGYFLYQAESLWFNMAEATYEPSVAPQYNTDPYPKGTIRYIEDRERKTAIECNRIWRERSMEWLKAHPTEYLAKVPGRLVYMYYNDMDNIIAFSNHKGEAGANFITLPYKTLLKQFDQLSAIQYLALANLVYYLAVLFCAAGGCLLVIKRKEYAQTFTPMMIVIGGSLALVLAVHGETRFKAPFMPFIFILASVYVASWRRKPHPTAEELSRQLL